jgi:ribosomal protein L2
MKSALSKFVYCLILNVEFKTFFSKMNPFIAFRPGFLQIRHKTFRKTDTKAFKKVIADMKYRKAVGLPARPSVANITENKFFKVVGNMKIYKPLSPGLTNRRHPTRFHLHKGPCIQRLSYGKRSTGGRSSNGRVAVRHRGGGHKKRVRMIDFSRATPGEYRVERFEYDPNRNGELMLMRNMSTNEFSYIIRTVDVPIGTILYSFPLGVPTVAPGETELTKSELIKDGNCLPIKNIPVGTFIHCIGLKPGGPAKMCRAAGTSAQILSITNGYAQLRMGTSSLTQAPKKSVLFMKTVLQQLGKLQMKLIN